MFYSQFILAKKGPLGTIWIAAHLERKLRKNQVADTDIGVSVDSILFPEAPIALRLSSHLLLGVVRIYSRKVNYLFDDCSEALLKIKQAFRSTAVDLPPEETTAPYHSITLPETFDLDDFELPDNEIFQSNYVDHHISTKEQITLQDTMEGVVYPTSQFGLDERFGDGDTSQIGLDIDEELFLDKDATSSHTAVTLDREDVSQTLMSSQVLLKDEKNDEMTEPLVAMAVDDSGNQPEPVTENVEPIEYAQAPSTPGLVEESNLLNFQKAQGCDDHMERNYHTSMEEAVGVLENASAGADLHHTDKSAVPLSPLKTMSAVGLPAKISDYQELQQSEQKNGLLSTVGKVDHVMTNKALAGSATDASINLDKLDDLPNGILGHGAPLISVGQTGEECRESHGIPCVASPSLSHDAYKLANKQCDDESVLRKTCLNPTFLPVDEGILEEDRVSHKAEVSQPVPKCHEVHSCYEPKGSKTQECDINEKPSNFTLSACNSQLNQLKNSSYENENSVVTNFPPNAGLDSMDASGQERAACASNALTELQGDLLPATNVVNPVSEVNKILKVSSCEDTHANCSNFDEQINIAFSKDYLENSNVSAISDLPMSEKLLPIPVGATGPENESLNSSIPDKELDQKVGKEGSIGNLENLNGAATSNLPTAEKLLSVIESELLVDATPYKGVPVESEGDGAGLPAISGKKRSFTESTLTMQSLNSVESFAKPQSKRTVESIPDDDNLLSSILVGRKSSTLKLKSTPPPNIVATKRPRTAARPSSYKRKVLLDDAMVLHGDMIRQQLTSTEDIRRVRKKAPSTPAEIWIIQKQFSDDDIFSQPVATGISEELICLYSQAFDPSRIRVSAECVGNIELLGRSNLIKATDREGSSAASVVRDDVELHRPATILHTGAVHMEPSTRPDPSRDPERDERSGLVFGDDVKLQPPATIVRKEAVGDMEFSGRSDLIRRPDGDGSSGQAVLLATAHTEHEVCNNTQTLTEYTTIATHVETSHGEPSIEMAVEGDGGTGAISIPERTLPTGTGVLPPYADQQIEACGLFRDHQLDAHCVDRDMLAEGANNEKIVDAIEVSKTCVDKIPVYDTKTGLSSEFLFEKTEDTAIVEVVKDFQTESFVPTDRSSPAREMTSLQTDGANVDIGLADCQAVKDVNNNEIIGVNCGECLVPDDINPPPNCMHEESKEDNLCSLELGLDVKHSSIDDNQNTCFKNAGSPDLELTHDVKNQSLTCTHGEEHIQESSHSRDAEAPMRNFSTNDSGKAFLNDDDKPASQESEPTATNNADTCIHGDPIVEDHGDTESMLLDHDTEFLNVDDDDVVEEYEDYVPSDQDTQFLDNSGWSLRTRAVAKYLQNLFDKEAGHRKVLPVSNLLIGKTRKEASRMFFETLVLKTRDYIHVEQGIAFDNINIMPRAKLMKSDF